MSWDSDRQGGFNKVGKLGMPNWEIQTRVLESSQGQKWGIRDVTDKVDEGVL